MFKTIQPPDNLYSVARISPTPFLGSSVGGKWLAALTTYVAAPVSLRHPLDTRPPSATAAAQKPVEVQFCLQLKCCHVPRDGGGEQRIRLGILPIVLSVSKRMLLTPKFAEEAMFCNNISFSISAPISLGRSEKAIGTGHWSHNSSSQ